MKQKELKLFCSITLPSTLITFVPYQLLFLQRSLCKGQLHEKQFSISPSKDLTHPSSSIFLIPSDCTSHFSAWEHSPQLSGCLSIFTHWSLGMFTEKTWFPHLPPKPLKRVVTIKENPSSIYLLPEEEPSSSPLGVFLLCPFYYSHKIFHFWSIQSPLCEDFSPLQQKTKSYRISDTGHLEMVADPSLCAQFH